MPVTDKPSHIYWSKDPATLEQTSIKFDLATGRAISEICQLRISLSHRQAAQIDAPGLQLTNVVTHNYAGRLLS
jgi:hypothetical protein